MLSFLRDGVDKLRSITNPMVGIIITHHTKKVSKTLLEKNPFQALSGAGSLRGFYTTGLVMFKPDETDSTRQIVFELRNGECVPSKLVDKTYGSWQLVDQWNS